MGVSNLKRKTVNGFFWSSLEMLFSQGQGILYGIVLARLLSPNEFGLLGMVTIFIAIAQVFVDSGLSQALIRKQNCTEIDYNTIFWVNIVIGIVAFVVIWILAPYIADFYEKPELINLTRVLALAIIISSLTLNQQTIITKNLDFKTLTKSSVLGTLVAGILSILMAIYGFGVWSLVWRVIINQAVRSLVLWYYNRWLPNFTYSKVILKEHFLFGSNLLLISVVAAIYKSFYNMIIGKNYPVSTLGYYTNAEQYSNMPATSISAITNKVSYPVLSEMQYDNARLRQSIKKLIETVMYISFIIMFGLAAVSRPLLTILLGAKWIPSIIYFQILCFAYAISPLLIINQNIMKIKGRSDLFLRTEIIKYLLFTPLLVLGAIYGIKVLLAGIVVFYWLSLFINSMYSKRLIGLTIMEQCIYLIPGMTIAGLSALTAWCLGLLFHFNDFLILTIQSFIFMGMVILLSILFKVGAFIEIKQILLNKLTLLNLLKALKIEK
ncbi:MAG TPA: lipopolysaccharide biosynthesis protein [Prolixibacteraceae bacterium]